jgi:hypothetical protein
MTPIPAGLPRPDLDDHDDQWLLEQLAEHGSDHRSTRSTPTPVNGLVRGKDIASDQPTTRI